MPTTTSATLDQDDDTPPALDPDSPLAQALRRVAEGAQQPAGEIIAAFSNYV